LTRLDKGKERGKDEEEEGWNLREFHGVRI
jgi:hypothetical protein